MKLSFYGAAKEVTGSKHLLTTDSGVNILLDCGLFQGRRKESEKKNAHFGFDPRSIDMVILSHAHIDHTGLLPKLVKEGFNGIVYCTPATYDLNTIMLPDSAHIQESDAEYASKKRIAEGKHPVEPLYEQEDAQEALSLMQTVPFYETIQICEEVELMFTENGHLLGSGTVNLKIKEGDTVKRLCYTGDIGRQTGSLLKVPQPFPQADFIISESTYGDREHGKDEFELNHIVQIINETCIEKGGKLIIPAFSIGRTQEIIFGLDYLHSQFKLPDIPVYIDSPLSTKGTDIYRRHLELFNKGFQEFLKKDKSPFDFPNLHFIESVEESKALNNHPDPCIIISASGMLEAGRIKHHVRNHIEDESTTILFVGYCAPSTIGGRLIAGEKEIKIYGEYYPVKANIEYIRSFSGHGDYHEMITFLNCQNKKEVQQIFLVHGDEEAQEAFKIHLNAEGFENVSIPDFGTVVNL